jgi:hypothetical protein
MAFCGWAFCQAARIVTSIFNLTFQLIGRSRPTIYHVNLHPKALFGKNNQPDYFPDYFLDYFYKTLCSDYINQE